MLNIANNKA